MNYVKITDNLFISIKIDKFNTKILTIRNQNSNKGCKVILKSIPDGISDNTINKIINLSSLPKKEYNKIVQHEENIDANIEIKEFLNTISTSKTIEHLILNSLTNEQKEMLTNKIVEPTIKDSEFYKYDKLKAINLLNKFPPEFLNKFNQIAKVNCISYRSTGTFIWAQALKEACMDCDCLELYYEYDKLTWEESDDFDFEITKKVKLID